MMLRQHQIFKCIILSSFVFLIKWRNISVEAVELHEFFVLVPKGTTEMCGGSIVAVDAVVTAANCLYDQSKQRWAVAEELYVLYGDFSLAHQWKAR